MTYTDQERAAIDAAMAVMKANLEALNALDLGAFAKTLHFPHYRLSGSNLQVWDTPDTYFDDFKARAGDGWHHTVWDKLVVIAAGADKVHLDVQFTRYREDDSSLGTFRSLWVIARIDGTWAALLRSTFAG